MDKVMNQMCEMFHDVLYVLAEKERFRTDEDVQTAKNAISGILKIKTLEAMEDYKGGSFRRGRGTDGRYVSRDNRTMKEKLEHMMQEAEGHDRDILHEMIEKL